MPNDKLTEAFDISGSSLQFGASNLEQRSFRTGSTGSMDGPNILGDLRNKNHQYDGE